ncbi:MAG: 4-(cytidine 5'-diphospho)-2-C-methyl-D-erythritol kinase [Bacillota bacterium]
MIISEKACAKINLSLDIVGRYPDGYHQMEMIMQSVSLADHLYLEKTAGGIDLDIESSEYLPDNEDNLIWKAAALMQGKFSDQVGGIKVKLDKHIPVAAGLAGGSTDAAAVLRGVNRLYNLDLDLTELETLAATLGADVPFCVQGGTAFAYAKGDKLIHLPDLEEYKVVLINPDFQVSTAEVFQAYAASSIELDIPTWKLIDKIKSKNNINWQEGWSNKLEPVVIKRYPEVGRIIAELKAEGACHAQLSGSGPTVIGFFRKDRIAEEVYNHWKKGNKYIVKFTGGLNNNKGWCKNDSE